MAKLNGENAAREVGSKLSVPIRSCSMTYSAGPIRCKGIMRSHVFASYKRWQLDALMASLVVACEVQLLNRAMTNTITTDDESEMVEQKLRHTKISKKDLRLPKVRMCRAEALKSPRLPAVPCQVSSWPPSKCHHPMEYVQPCLRIRNSLGK